MYNILLLTSEVNDQTIFGIPTLHTCGISSTPSKSLSC